MAQKKSSAPPTTVQAVTQLRHVGLFGLEAEVVGNKFEIVEFVDDFDIINDPEIVFEEYSLGEVFGYIDISLDNEVKVTGNDGLVKRLYAIEFIQKPIDVLAEGADLDIELMQGAWEMVSDFGTRFSKTETPSMEKSDALRVAWLLPQGNGRAATSASTRGTIT